MHGRRRKKDIADFNAVLTKNNLPALKVAPVKATNTPCTFKPSPN